MPVLDYDPGQSPEAPGTLMFYRQGQDPSTGFQVTTEGVITSPGGTTGPVNATGSAATTDVLTARVTGDTQPRFTINADGDLEWGSGSGAPDFTIARYAAGGLEILGAALRMTSGQILFGPGGDVNLYYAAAGELKTDDNLTVGAYLNVDSGQSNGQWNLWGGTIEALRIGTAGGGMSIKEGANARMGVATLVAGTVTVANTSVTANTRVFLTAQNTGGTPGALRVSARAAGASFTITSTSGADTSQVAWMLVEPAS